MSDSIFFDKKEYISAAEASHKINVTRDYIARLCKNGELIGKRVVVVNNLEPATIRGVESKGMLLAANDGEKIILVSPDREISSGAQVR